MSVDDDSDRRQTRRRLAVTALSWALLLGALAGVVSFTQRVDSRGGGAGALIPGADLARAAVSARRSNGPVAAQRAGAGGPAAAAAALPTATADSSDLSVELRDPDYPVAPRSLPIYGRWDRLAEPHRSMHLAAAGLDRLDGGGVSWTIRASAHGRMLEESTAEGANISFTFTRPGQLYEVTISELTDAGTRVATNGVMCKYVRREMRDLAADHRLRYLRALGEMYFVSTEEEGWRKYGRKFTTMERLVKKHLEDYNINDCSPIHGAPTFVTGHAAYSLEFEQALQAVDPTVAAHYWDYTYDSEKYGVNWNTRSVYFSDDWFGPAGLNFYDGDNTTLEEVVEADFGAQHQLRGRFAGVRVYDAGYDSPNHNAYGLLTETFNQNPSLLVTRAGQTCGLPMHQALPGCEQFRGMIATTNIYDLWTAAEFGVHLALHMQIGGAAACPYDAGAWLRAKPEERGPMTRNLGFLLDILPAGSAVLLMRGFKKEKLGTTQNSTSVLVCPLECDAAAGEVGEACECGCPTTDAMIDALEEDALARGCDGVCLSDFLTTYALFRDSGTPDVIMSQHQGNYTTIAYIGMYKILEIVGNATWHEMGFAHGQLWDDGPLLRAGVNHFWWAILEDGSYASARQWVDFMTFATRSVCHPGILGQFSSPLASPNDPLFWPIHVGFERYWSYNRLTQPGFNNTWDDILGCRGWNMSDFLPFHDLGNGPEVTAPAGEEHWYTNYELVELFDPLNPTLPYVWENFDWGHCTENVKQMPGMPPAP